MGVISQTLAAAFEKRIVPLMDNGFFDPSAYSSEEFWQFDEPDEPDECLEDGRYPARVTGIEEGDDLIEFCFKISCGPWAGTEVCGDVENDLSRESEARDWVESILRRPLEESERIDLDLHDLVGGRCEIKVVTSFDSPSVVAIFGVSSEDPELEELRLREKVLRHDPLDPECVKRHCEESERLFRDAEAILARSREARRKRRAQADDVPAIGNWEVI